MKEIEISRLKDEIESAHINFLIGAGASMPFLETLNKLEDNITAVSETVTDIDKLKILKGSIYKEYLEQCLLGNLLFNVDDIKEYKKECEEREDGKCDEFISVRDSYNLFIKHINHIVSSNDLNLRSKQVNLFTTNVDVFLEEALEKNKSIFNDGFSGRRKMLFDTVNFHNSVFKRSSHYEYTSELPLFNLFKIHGSLNWEKGKVINGEYEVLFNTNLSNLNKLNKIISSQTDYFELYDDISEFSKNRNSKDRKSKYLESIEVDSDRIKAVEGFLDEYAKIVMVNPTKKKFEDTTKNLHYYEMLRLYSNNLERENSLLFVLGYSFRDEHILRITQRVVKSNPTLTVYILCHEKDKVDFTKKFESFNNVKYLIAKEGYFDLFELNALLKEVLQEIPKSSKI